MTWPTPTLVLTDEHFWFDAFRCPDPAFDAAGRLHVYFKGFTCGFA